MNKIQKTDHFYLIDGSGYIFRAYYALPPLSRKSDGTVQVLDGCVELQVDAGDRLLIATPGGGGFDPITRSAHPSVGSSIRGSR